MSEPAPARRRARSGGGAARRAERTAVKFEAEKFITRRIPNFEILDEEALQIIEANAEIILEAPVYGPPFVRDMEGGRRYATIEDFRNFVKLGHVSKWLHHSGGTVCEPTDIAVNKRHLDMLHAHMTLTDKPFMGSVTEPSRAQDSVDMCGLV